MSPFWTSVVVALSSLALATPAALAGGWLLARCSFRGKTFVNLVFLSPLILPPVVTGYLLLMFLGRTSCIGAFLEDTLGIHLSFSLLGAVIAATVVGFPLFVSSVRLAIESVPTTMEDSAHVAGASAWQVFWRVTFPAARPGIAAGAMLAFGRAMGEFGATIVLAGSMQNESQTLAVAIYEHLDDPAGDHAALTLTLLSVLVSFLALLGYEQLSKRTRQSTS